MLALSRKEGERIFVGNDIVIEIRAIHNNRVVISVSAPEDVLIDREEVHYLRQVEGEQSPNLPNSKAGTLKPGGTVPKRAGLKQIVRQIDVAYAQRALCFESAKLPTDGLAAMSH